MFHSCLHARTEAVEGLGLRARSVATDPLRQLQSGCLWPLAPEVGRGWNGGGGKAVPSCVPEQERETEAEMSLERSRDTEL